MIKRHPVISVAIVVVLVAAGLFLTLRPSLASNAAPKADVKKEQPKEERKLPVETVLAKTGTISNSIVTTATLDPDSQVTVIAETNGIVSNLQAEEGSFVREGQTLAVLADDQKKVALSKAEIRLLNAQREWDRKEKSFNEKVISKQEYDKAKYDVEVAEADVKEAKVNIDRMLIRAPFSGTVTQRFIEKGQNIKPQDQLFTLVDADPLEAKIYLPEKEIYGIKTGQTVYMALNAQKGITFTGQIRQINPAVDPKTGTVKVTVEVRQAPDAVRPGSFVDARLETQRHDRAILIPKKAILEETGERFAFVIQKDKAFRRTITVGFTDDQNAEVLSGISNGEPVVISGQGSLRDGSKTETVGKK